MPKIRHFSIDNETLDVTAPAHLLSIGVACEYDGQTHSMIVYPNWAQQETLGRTKSAETLAWWNKQDNALKTKTFETAEQSLMTAEECLRAINTFIVEHSKGVDRIMVWGNGPEFDIAQIEHLSKQVGVPTVWHYALVSSQRTIEAIAKSVGIRFDKNSFYDGQAHDAEADARGQVRIINHLWDTLHEQKTV